MPARRSRAPGGQHAGGHLELTLDHADPADQLGGLDRSGGASFTGRVWGGAGKAPSPTTMRTRSRWRGDHPSTKSRQWKSGSGRSGTRRRCPPRPRRNDLGLGQLSSVVTPSTMRARGGGTLVKKWSPSKWRAVGRASVRSERWPSRREPHPPAFQGDDQDRRSNSAARGARSAGLAGRAHCAASVVAAVSARTPLLGKASTLLVSPHPRGEIARVDAWMMQASFQ